MQLAAKALTEAAETHGYVLEGDAAPNIEGLADYTVAVRSDLGQTHAASSSQAKAANCFERRLTLSQKPWRWTTTV